jgi:hypothetical protein
MKEKKKMLKNICSHPSPGLTILPEKISYSDHIKMCETFGGNVGVTKDKGTIESFVSILNKAGVECNKGPKRSFVLLWAGFSDYQNEGYFVSPNNFPINNQFWQKSEPNGQDIENCVAINYRGKMLDFSCGGDIGHLCGVCDLLRVPEVTLRGDFGAMDLDRFYYWEASLVEGKYSFRGWKQSRVWYGNGKWVIGWARTGVEELVMLFIKK